MLKASTILFFFWGVISGKAVYVAIFIEEVSVVFKYLALWHLHLPLLASEPSDDHWLGQACHQAESQQRLQVIVQGPALLCHQVCHIVLRQLVGTAVHLLTGGARVSGAKWSYFSSHNTTSSQAKVKSRETTGHHLGRDYTNEDACSKSGRGFPRKNLSPSTAQELFGCLTIKLQILILVAVLCSVFKRVSSSVVPQGYRFAVVTSLVKGGKGVCVASDGGHVVVAPHAST